MPDIVTSEIRSRMMSGIRSKNTRPEILLRSGLHRAGFRFRLHDRKLPGKPDLVFPRRHAVLFAHGCFWHGHDCHLFRLPSTRASFWKSKITRNHELDVRAKENLFAEGWRYGVVWECAIKGKTRIPLQAIIDRIAVWLRSDLRQLEIRGNL